MKKILLILTTCTGLTMANFPAYAGTPRRVVQIMASADEIYIVCDDGTVWDAPSREVEMGGTREVYWRQLPLPNP
jgi:hypothetical protein